MPTVRPSKTYPLPPLTDQRAWPDKKSNGSSPHAPYSGQRAFWALALVVLTLITIPSGCHTRSSSQVEVLYAGSLAKLFEHSIGPAFTTHASLTFRGEPRASGAAVQLLRINARSPDVVILADPQLLDQASQLPPWHIRFARNSLVLAYREGSRAASSFAQNKDPWYATLKDPNIRIGRADPAIDPLGYRTLFLFRLAEDYYGTVAIEKPLVEKSMVFPEEALLAHLDSGHLDAAFVYRSMAIDWGAPFLELPPPVNLGHSHSASAYEALEHVFPSGHIATGAPIQYALAIPETSPNPSGAQRFLCFLLSPEGVKLCQEAGLEPLEGGPIIVGDAPDDILQSILSSCAD